MKKLSFLILTLIGLFLSNGNVIATPSTTYWTPATTDIQPLGVLHLGVDNYFTVFKKAKIGGGGVGLYYFFTKDISLLTGPVWFNEKEINGKWKWTLQLDINVDPVNGFKQRLAEMK